MRLLKKNSEIAPSTFFATLLNASCSSLLLTNVTEDSTIYLVVGKGNGETVFFPIDRSECISKFDSELSVPITALVAGDLRNVGTKEVVTVTSNGVLQSLSYPTGDPACPVRIFGQHIYANVCFAEILDIDNDGLMEFLVAMTDRVVRSYRFLNEIERLVPLNKWEMPSHISSCCVGLGSERFALFSQSDRNQFIQLDFSAKGGVCIVQPSNTAAVSEPSTQLVISSKPHSTLMFHCLAERILVIDKEQKSELELNCMGGCVACVTTVVLPSGLTVLVTADPWGQMLIFGWTENDEIKSRDPIARCQVSRDVDYICGFPGSAHEFSLIISIVNIYNKIAIFLIDLSHIISN